MVLTIYLYHTDFAGHTVCHQVLKNMDRQQALFISVPSCCIVIWASVPGEDRSKTGRSISALTIISDTNYGFLEEFELGEGRPCKSIICFTNS